jgi:hypothetical protein
MPCCGNRSGRMILSHHVGPCCLSLRQLAALEARYKEQNPGMLEDDDGQEDFVELLHGEDPPEEPSPVELTPAPLADADDLELDDMDDLVTPSISLGDWVSGSASVGGASPAMSLSSFSSMPQESPEPRRFGALPQGKGIKKLFSKLRKGVP